MSLFHLILLALIQGITEFLPISSSAHLILLPELMRWADQGALIDVMAHLGTLFAVMVYFYRDIAAIARGNLAWLSGRMTPGGRLALLIGAATPPVLIVGAALYLAGAADALRSPALIAWATIGFAILLWAADRWGPIRRSVEELSYSGAFLIGLAQAFALIPGASRSGVTMTAARALGVTRTEAARFSMLMAIPVIAAFGLVAGFELYRGEAAGASLSDGLIVMGLSFVSALGAIHVLMRLLARMSFTPFVIYRLVLGGFLLWLAMSA